MPRCIPMLGCIPMPRDIIAPRGIPIPECPPLIAPMPPGMPIRIPPGPRASAVVALANRRSIPVIADKPRGSRFFIMFLIKATEICKS
jgi:hypothetical protein